MTGALVQCALKVDEHLVVPKFDEFLHHSALLASSCRLIGCDGDGKVQIVDPAAFRRGDGAELGYIETTQVTNRLYFHKKANFSLKHSEARSIYLTLPCRCLGMILGPDCWNLAMDRTW